VKKRRAFHSRFLTKSLVERVWSRVPVLKGGIACYIHEGELVGRRVAEGYQGLPENGSRSQLLSRRTPQVLVVWSAPPASVHPAFKCRYLVIWKTKICLCLYLIVS
jgi:hypothetical protein